MRKTTRTTRATATRVIRIDVPEIIWFPKLKVSTTSGDHKRHDHKQKKAKKKAAGD
jgi:hypothetical protein